MRTKLSNLPTCTPNVGLNSSFSKSAMSSQYLSVLFVRNNLKFRCICFWVKFYVFKAQLSLFFQKLSLEPKSFDKAIRYARYKSSKLQPKQSIIFGWKIDKSSCNAAILQIRWIVSLRHLRTFHEDPTNLWTQSRKIYLYLCAEGLAPAFVKFYLS